MNRSRVLTLFALFALFCGPLAGSAVASSGTVPTITSAESTVIGTQLSATPNLAVDFAAWEVCPDGVPNGTILAEGPLVGSAANYTLALSDAGTDVCAVEIDALGGTLGYTDAIGPVEGLPAGAGPTLGTSSGPIAAGQSLSQATSALVVNHGSWGAAQSITDVWEDCDAAGEVCVPVFTGPSYQLSRSDVGSTIEVLERAVAANGAQSSDITPLTGIVSASAPTVSSSDPPTINGTPQIGNTLTVSPGTWSNQPTSYTYQWERCSNGTTCTAIDGATGSTYTPGMADVGDTLFVYVAGAVDLGASYGSVGSPYPSYPTNSVFGVSSSPPGGTAPTTVVPVTSLHSSSGAVGRLTATMRWTFRYAPSYTQIAALSVQGPAVGATIATRCAGKGCPFAVRRIKVRELKRCRARPSGHCRAPREVSLEWQFRGHNLAVGSRVTVMISRALDIGKYYRFVVRRRRAPSVNISCVAPGSIVPGKNCTGL
jgi:hypothetical protein